MYSITTLIPVGYYDDDFINTKFPPCNKQYKMLLNSFTVIKKIRAR